MAGPIENYFRSSLGSNGAGTVRDQANDDHVPIVFTSAYRRHLTGIKLEKVNELEAAVALSRTTLDTLKYSQAINPVSGSVSYAPQEDIIQANEAKREAAVKSLKEEPVTLLLNPRSISFEQPKRFTKVDTLRGSVYYHFTDDNAQNNDILKLTFQGSTGPILIVPGMTEEQKLEAQKNLSNWHNLYQLTREPMYYIDASTMRVRNRFYIIYASPLIPVPITFTGFFENVLKFSESADKPRSRNYDMSFTVEEVSPPLNSLLQNQSEYEGLSFVTPQVVDLKDAGVLGVL